MTLRRKPDRPAGAAAMVGAILVLAGAAINLPPARADEISDRLRNQQQRIDEGVRNGSLTKQEAKRLEDRQRQLRREHQRLARNGLSSRDRDALNRDLDQQ